MASREASIVFSPGQIGSLEIKNRLVRSATYENAAGHQGEVTDDLVDLYLNLAMGGVGLIITGITSVMASNHFPPRSMRIDDDRFLPGLKRISEAVHSLDNGCKIMLQLHHPGRQVIAAGDGARFLSFLPPARLTAMQREGGAPEPEDIQTPEPVAPSALPDALFGRTPRALSRDEIQAIVRAFAEGIGRAEQAGFDGVQLHAAHGWLLSSFLSPHTNKREDEYGGSSENRTRIVREIYELGQQKVSPDFPILIKMNTTDFFPDGTDPEEAAQVVRILDQSGFSAFETSGGMWKTITSGSDELGWPAFMLPESRTGLKKKDQEAYFLAGARAVKAVTHKPVMLVGGIKTFSRMEEILASGRVDFLSMARPLIRQPDLPHLLLSDQKDKADCISCNACLGTAPLSCGALESK